MKEAIPLDPVVEILRAFRSHRVVALGEGDHGNEQGHAFRLGLIRDPRFAATVNDIVVEFGNALYQDTMDRFMNGEKIPYGELRKTWENTTQTHDVWDAPIYEEFYRAVRDVNASLPPERRLRVLLSDAPFDWDQVRSLEDFAKQPDRTDDFVANLIEREVLARGRRALVIYGDGHLLRRDRVFLSAARYEPGPQLSAVGHDRGAARGQRNLSVLDLHQHLNESDVVSIKHRAMAAAQARDCSAYPPGRRAVYFLLSVPLGFAAVG
jgi:hypothetical protein